MHMSYWGNTYMPMVDELAIGAAREYVTEHGKAMGHAWWICDGTTGTDEQAFRYIVCCIAEASEDYAEDPDEYRCRYEKCIFDALVFAIETLKEGDWSTYDDCGWAVKLNAA